MTVSQIAKALGVHYIWKNNITNDFKYFNIPEVISFATIWNRKKFRSQLKHMHDDTKFFKILLEHERFWKKKCASGQKLWNFLQKNSDLIETVFTRRQDYTTRIWKSVSSHWPTKLVYYAPNPPFYYSSPQSLLLSDSVFLILQTY